MKNENRSGELLYNSPKKTLSVVGIALVIMIVGIQRAHASYEHVKGTVDAGMTIVVADNLATPAEPQQIKVYRYYYRWQDR